MARQINRLSARAVQTLTAPGRHSDGGGLYLIIDSNGAKRWAFLYRDRRTQKLREMGFGGLAAVTLAQARDKAANARAVLANGGDPIGDRRSNIADVAVPTFGSVADEVIAAMETGWRNEKHRAQWKMTLKVYCKPLRALPVNVITTEDVLSVLQPIWQKTPETANRVRGRIERVLDAAKAKGQRTGDNPAHWRGHLDNLLPKQQRLTRGHHAAMPFGDVPAFTARLQDRPTVAGLALQFLILTATRTAETIGAEWEEIDTASRVWTIPAARMKAGRPHTVPLSSRAIEILREAEKFGRTGYIFPGQKSGKPLSHMAFLALLRRMKLEDVTGHGFRSSFRDWCGECTPFPREVAEAALAHAIQDKVEAAYRRATALEKRRELMEAWATFCSTAPSFKVVPLRWVHA